MQLLLKTQTDFKDLEDDDPQVGGPELLRQIPMVSPLFFPHSRNYLPSRLDLLHDLCLGQNVQDPGEGVPAVPACGDGPTDEDRLHQARGGPARQ